MEDRGNLGHDGLMKARNQFLRLAAQDPLLAGVRPNGLDDTPQLHIDIDQDKATALGLSLADINTTLSTAWGGSFVNDFVDRGRVKQVYMQADAPYRMVPDDLNRWYVRSATGEMVPFSSFATSHWTLGPAKLERFNGVGSLEIQGTPAPGHSSGTAMDEVEKLFAAIAQGRRPRMDRPLLSGAPGRLADLCALRHFAARRLPAARRAVRELVDPARR